MEENSSLMLEHRCDRQKLLEFIISSSNLIKQVRTSSGPTLSLSNINLDTLNADYVLNCVNSGGVSDVAEATNSYYHELEYPHFHYFRQPFPCKPPFYCSSFPPNTSKPFPFPSILDFQPPLK
ncbi:uncharacterized protein LOC110737272 [Chenopodium quinoa]|uniref:uncharacterized protein LOC110737272 n=1 Tax=Chenopodium quinoa TaxID=63459 RepID=UPI000B78D135|nr:uncharacterized protein LOC110737272 [Chenopodium quinoa]